MKHGFVNDVTVIWGESEYVTVNVEFVIEGSLLYEFLDRLKPAGRDASREPIAAITWTNSFLHRVGKQCGTKDVPSLKAYVEQLEAEVAEYEAVDRRIAETDSRWEAAIRDLEHMTAERDELEKKIERDYVRRDDYDFMADALKCMKAERDEWKAKTEQAERAMNKAAGKWAKADAESRELRKMLALDDGTIEEHTERADPMTTLAHQKQLAEEWRDRCHNAEALCDKLESERDEWKAKAEQCNPCGWWNTHLQHCELTVRAVAAETEADELKAIVDRLKAENAELRDEFADCAIKRANRVLSQSVDRLTRERDALAVDLEDAMDGGLA